MPLVKLARQSVLPVGQTDPDVRLAALRDILDLGFAQANCIAERAEWGAASRADDEEIRRRKGREPRP